MVEGRGGGRGGWSDLCRHWGGNFRFQGDGIAIHLKSGHGGGMEDPGPSFPMKLNSQGKTQTKQRHFVQRKRPLRSGNSGKWGVKTSFLKQKKLNSSLLDSVCSVFKGALLMGDKAR